MAPQNPNNEPQAPEPPTTFQHAPSLAAYLVSPAAFLQRHPEVTCLVAGAIVADASASPERILLVQRSRDDSCPLLWEIPGGRCEASDASLMAGAVRELWEESGLRAARVSDLVEESVGRAGRWRKFTFLVEVEREEGEGEDEDGAEDEEGKEAGMEVRLDPEEHEDYVWASEDDVLRGTAQGRELNWTGHSQMLTVLRGFQLVKMKKEQDNAGTGEA